VAAHRGIVKGVSVAPHGANFFVSCGDDSRAKLWGLHRAAAVDAAASGEAEPLATFVGGAAFTGVDHHWSRQQFATSSETVQVWDPNRSAPVHAFKWGHDATLSVRFNPAEPELLASTGRDRSVGLYDLRAASALKKVVLEAYCSAMAWNPREPMHFVSACEDGHLYAFDMRKLDRPTMIHKVRGDVNPQNSTAAHARETTCLLDNFAHLSHILQSRPFPRFNDDAQMPMRTRLTQNRLASLRRCRRRDLLRTTWARCFRWGSARRAGSS
jgi:WD40 repeat protein